MRRMKQSALIAWVLGAMQSIQPEAPWKETYPTTASAIARVSIEEPLFAGERGPLETASVLLATAWFESNFKIDAKGDCTKGGLVVPCKDEGAVPHSFGLYQINETNFAGLKIEKATWITEDAYASTRAARSMMNTSFKMCRARPQEEWLGWYAAGGEGCRGVTKSKHRMLKAKWIVSRYPYKENEDE